MTVGKGVVSCLFFVKILYPYKSRFPVLFLSLLSADALIVSEKAFRQHRINNGKTSGLFQFFCHADGGKTCACKSDHFRPLFLSDSFRN